MKPKYYTVIPTVISIGVFAFVDDKPAHAYDGHPQAEMVFAVSSSTAVQDTISGNMVEFPPRERRNNRYIR